MKFRNKIKAIDTKTFVIPLIITAIILISVDNFMNDGIKSHYYNHIKEESLNFAKNYSQSLTKIAEAQEIVNTLIESKLLVASKTITIYDGKFSNELLDEMARNLEIDVIYYYNPLGKIVYSSGGNYIGWKASEGHPVYDFMMSSNISLVEDIRKDSESELYYKYGYFKASNGSFVQIGVLAEKVQSFLDSFEIQGLIEDLKETEVAVQICFIDNNFYIVGSTDKQLIGTEVKNYELKEAILLNKEYVEVGSLNSESVYNVYVPVYSKEHRIGTLHVAQPLTATEELIQEMNIASIIGISTIFLSLIYVIVSIYSKNKQLIKLAYYDTLTDLPNKEYLMNYLGEKIEKEKDDKKAILLINCSNFRTINLISGYQYGDKVIQEIAYRLRKVSNSYCKLFRFTGDRFVICVNDYRDQNDLVELSNKISEIFNDPIITNKYIDIQIGILEIDNKYKRTDDILKDVSIALSYINSNNINYVFFNGDMEKKLEREDIIEIELRTAILNKDSKMIYLEYQPLVDLKTNRIIGFEALARMKTEKLGYISPVEFIDVAERKQLIVSLGNLILKTACDFINKLNKQGYQDIKVAVNVSGFQLLRDDFTDLIMEIIKDTGINGTNLELEITESILVENFDTINEMLKNLREIGTKIALDDFGTGYSSFARLKELNIDFVKIDKYFIDKITTSERNGLITGDIISMSHKIGLAVVAEGVETETQKEYLIENNCDIMQGYLFSKPLLEENALKILKENK